MEGVRGGGGEDNTALLLSLTQLIKYSTGRLPLFHEAFFAAECLRRRPADSESGGAAARPSYTDGRTLQRAHSCHLFLPMRNVHELLFGRMIFHFLIF